MVMETFEAVEISDAGEGGPTVSWAAVAAGAIAAASLTLVLLAFGVGMGFSVVSPWGNLGVSASTFEIGTGLYLIVVAMLASSIGGYIAGRLRTKWVGVHTHEVFFRDTAHGFLAWGFATVLGASFWPQRPPTLPAVCLRPAHRQNNRRDSADRRIIMWMCYCGPILQAQIRPI